MTFPTSIPPASGSAASTSVADIDDEIDFDYDEKEPKASLLRRIVVKIRLLPMVIFFSTLTLTVRIGDIWDGVDTILNGTVTVAEIQAQTADDGGVDAGLPMADEDIPGMTPDLEGFDPDAPVAMPEEDQAAVAARMLADDPTLLTQSEIDLLQKLAERRVEIDARAKELKTREALLAAAEARIESKIQDFKALQATIENLIVTYDEQQDAKLLSLVKIYENMKPKDAARIFEELEMDVLLQVAERMKERSLAPIMAKMNPQRARDVTIELNALRKIPRPMTEDG